MIQRLFPSLLQEHLAALPVVAAVGWRQKVQALLPFEVKASQSVTSADASPIERWIALNPGHGPGLVIHAGTDCLPLSQNVRAMPASALFCTGK